MFFPPLPHPCECSADMLPGGKASWPMGLKCTMLFAFDCLLDDRPAGLPIRTDPEPAARPLPVWPRHHFHPQEPFYSDRQDVPPRPTIFAGRCVPAWRVMLQSTGATARAVLSTLSPGRHTTCTDYHYQTTAAGTQHSACGSRLKLQLPEYTPIHPLPQGVPHPCLGGRPSLLIQAARWPPPADAHCAVARGSRRGRTSRRAAAAPARCRWRGPRPPCA